MIAQIDYCQNLTYASNNKLAKKLFFKSYDFHYAESS
jgi:hypothetical protein